MAEPKQQSESTEKQQTQAPANKWGSEQNQKGEGERNDQNRTSGKRSFSVVDEQEQGQEEEAVERERPETESSDEEEMEGDRKPASGTRH